MMASDTLMGLAAEAGQSARSHIRVRGILFSGVPRGGQTVFDLAFDFRQVRFFNPKPMFVFLHGVFARKYLTDAGYCRQPELWGDRGPYSGLDDDVMVMSTMAKPPRMPATVMPVLFFLDATTVSSSRTVR